MNHEMGKKSHVLHFRMMNVVACMDIQFIVKVLPLVRAETVPQGAYYLAGLINLAGKSIPLVDLAMMLGMERKSLYSTDMPVLLCSNGTDEMAIIVDAVLGLADFNESQLQINPELKQDASPFPGSINFNGQLSLLIDMKKIFLWNESHAI